MDNEHTPRTISTDVFTQLEGELSPLAQAVETLDERQSNLTTQLAAVMRGEGGTSQRRALDTLEQTRSGAARAFGEYAQATLDEYDKPLHAVEQISQAFLHSESELLQACQTHNPEGAYVASDGEIAITDYLASCPQGEINNIAAFLYHSISRDNIAECITTAPSNRQEMAELEEQLAAAGESSLSHKLRNTASFVVRAISHALKRNR